jgi:ssDNA thymidine ADP-ribosyltransferase, DarT
LVPKPTPIFHITHIRNLRSILDSQGLHCVTTIKTRDLSYTNIAHQSIQDYRATFYVPVEPFGTLHDYVPFYFAPRSPMLYTIMKGNVAGYTDGQEPIIYLVSTVEEISKSSIPFCFTDGHGIMAFTRYFKDVKDLTQIDWEIMRAKYWRDTLEDNDRRRRRQAEFLVYQFVPISCIKWICVINGSIKAQVEGILNEFNFQIPVFVKSTWYY